MQFTPAHSALILAGVQTQARRRCTPNDWIGAHFRRDARFALPEEDSPAIRDGEAAMVVHGFTRDRFRVGQCLALQPGRGTRGIGRIRLTALRYCARAGAISAADARAEGEGSVDAWRAAYARVHGAAALDAPCWALSFVVVEEGAQS